MPFPGRERYTWTNCSPGREAPIAITPACLWSAASGGHGRSVCKESSEGGLDRAHPACRLLTFELTRKEALRTVIRVLGHVLHRPRAPPRARGGLWDLLWCRRCSGGPGPGCLIGAVDSVRSGGAPRAEACLLSPGLAKYDQQRHVPSCANVPDCRGQPQRCAIRGHRLVRWAEQHAD